METALENSEQDEEKNITWEHNHQKIMKAINEAMRYLGALPPTVTEISKATGLSRNTIYKHIREYSTHAAYKLWGEMFGMLESDVLMGISHSAVRGNVKAARLYLELTGKIESKAAHRLNSTGDTNVQINGIVLNQQILQNLSEEQLKKIEEIIKPVVSESQSTIIHLPDSEKVNKG